jgi:hypothetical protein
MIVPNYKNKNMAKDTKYVKYDSVPITMNMKKFWTRNPKTSMNEVYLVGYLDQLKNNEFALLVFVSIWKLGHPNFHKGYHPINFLK